MEEIERYYDSDLDDRIEEVANEMQAELDGITKRVHREYSKELAALDAERKVHKVRMGHDPGTGRGPSGHGSLTIVLAGGFNGRAYAIARSA